MQFNPIIPRYKNFNTDSFQSFINISMLLFCEFSQIILEYIFKNLALQS